MSTQEKILRRLHTLGIPELENVQSLNDLPGAFVNMNCRWPNGVTGTLLDDARHYFGTQVEKVNSDRCYGVAGDEQQLAVYEYGCDGVDAVLVLWTTLA